MSVWAAFTIVLSVVTIGHLLITLGLVRRLRTHTDLLNRLADNSDRLLPEGTPIPAFTARTTDGRTITQAYLRHPAAVALLAVDCPHCRTNLPDFVAYVRSAGHARDRVPAVVAAGERTDPAARQDMLDALAPVATLVSEAVGTPGAVAAAFGAQAFPVFYLMRPDATIAMGTHTVRNLPHSARHLPDPAHR